MKSSSRAFANDVPTFQRHQVCIGLSTSQEQNVCRLTAWASPHVDPCDALIRNYAARLARG